MNRIKIVLLCSIILTGCTSHVEKDYFDARGEGILLKSKSLGIDSVTGWSFCKMVIGDKLIQYLVGDKYAFSVYNIKGDSLLYENKFVINGNGPYELKVAKIKYLPDRNEMLIFSESASENDVYRVRLNDFNNLYDTKNWEKQKLPVLAFRSTLDFVNDSLYLLLSLTKENSLFSLAYKGKDNYIKSLNFPYPVDEKESASLKFSLFMGKLIKHPTQPKFIYSNNSFRYVMVFELDNEEIKNVRYLSAVVPDYKPVHDNLYWKYSLNKDTKGNCRVIVATEQYCYIGYNNMTIKDKKDEIPFKGYPNAYFDRINVFDWDGNFVKRLVLDQPVYCFSVSPDERYIYATSVDLTQENLPDQVLRFELEGE